MNNVIDIVKRCLSFDYEQDWFDFKDNWYELDEIGQYISALSNAAVMSGEPFGYMIWGVNNTTHELTNTKFKYKKDIKNEPIEHYLSRNISPAIFFSFDEDFIDGNRVVVLSIPAARIVPTEFKSTRYIHVGSSKENIRNHPEREAALFRVLNYGRPSLLNTESRFDDLSFDQLFLYFDMKGIKLSKKTFKTAKKTAKKAEKAEKAESEENTEKPVKKTAKKADKAETEEEKPAKKPAAKKTAKKEETKE